MLVLSQLDHIALSVSDPRRSEEWYRSVLGLERRFQETWGDQPIMMCAGDTCIALFRAKRPAETSGAPPRIAMLHVAFRTDRRHFQQAQAELRTLKIPFEFQDHQISHSIYFHDPDGHEIEITTYLNGA